MSVLTRIKNNQITDSTIFANTKIAPGSIVGSLFSSNITVTSDFLITGNFTVLGSSTVSTVASTNTFVNDPLIVLNNAFSSTNTYDLGLVFNRGSSTNQAFIWNEFNSEFRLLATSETGSTYGNVNQTSFANIRLGNVAVQYDLSARNITASGTLGVTGDLTLTGDLAVNGGDLTTTAGTFNLVNANATTLNIGGAATTLGIGAATGTASLNNANIWMPNATTVGGAQSTVALFNIPATVNAFQSATALSLGATTGILEARNANIWLPNATTVDGAQTSVSLLTQNATTVSAFTAATTANIGAGSGTITINNPTLVGQQTTQNLYNTVATTMNFAGAATAVATGATTGYYNIRNANLQLQSATIINAPALANIFSASSTLDIANIAVATIGIGGATTTMDIGGSAGVVNHLGNVTIQSTAPTTSGSTGALVVNGGVAIAGDLRLAGNLYLANVIGTITNTITVQDPLLYLQSGNTYPYNYDIGFYSSYTGGPANVYAHTGLIKNDSDYQWYLIGNIAEPSAGAFSLTDAIYETLVLGNIVLKTPGGITTDQTTTNLVNTTATTVNLGGAATTLTMGATSGTATINNAVLSLPTASNIFVGQTTATIANTVVTTLNTAGSATAIAIGAATGTTTFRHDVNIATVTGTATTSYLTGALKVNGGIGVTGNIMIKSDQQFILGSDLAASTASGNILTPVNSQVQFYSNTNSNVRVVVQNINSGVTATVGTAYVHETGTPGTGYFDVGIMSGSGANLGSLKSGDGFAYVQETSAGYGGNLHLGAGRNIRMFAGGDLWLDTQQVVEIFDGNLSFAVVSTTAATSASTGALTVTGGVGIRSNLWVANGAVINSSNSSENFTVRGKVATSLIQTDSAYGAVIIGGSNASPQLGATLKVNSTDSLMIPVGSSAQRPSNSGNVDVKGMIRYNDTINSMEFYDGAVWQITGSVFTVISDRQFSGNTAYGNVDGVNTTFTLQGNATTASTLISINGIVQFPVLAYSVTDDILEFTEAPAVTDVIDARILTTTQTVSGIASGNGYNQFITDAAGSAIWTGTSATIQRVLVDPVGNMNFVTGNKVTYDQTVVNVPSSGTPVLVDTWAVASYGTAKYIVQAKNGANKVESMEVLLAAEGSNAYMTTYAVVNSNGVMGTLSANVVSGNARLYYTSTSLSNSNVKVMTTLIV